MFRDRDGKRYGWIDESRTHPFQTWGECQTNEHVANPLQRTIRTAARQIKSGFSQAKQKVQHNIQHTAEDLKQGVRKNIDTYKSRLGAFQHRLQWLTALMPAPIVYGLANLTTYGVMSIVIQLFLGLGLHMLSGNNGLHSQWVTATNILTIASLSFLGGKLSISQLLPTLCLCLLAARYLGQLTARYRHFVAKCGQSASPQPNRVETRYPILAAFFHYCQEAIFVIMLCSPVILANSQYLGASPSDVPVFTLVTPIGTLNIPNLLKYNAKMYRKLPAWYDYRTIPPSAWIGLSMFIVGYISSLYFDYVKRKIRKTMTEPAGVQPVQQRPSLQQGRQAQQQDDQPENIQQDEQQQVAQQPLPRRAVSRHGYFMDQGIFSYVRYPQVISMVLAKMGLWAMCLKHFDHFVLTGISFSCMVGLIIWKIFTIWNMEQRRLGIKPAQQAPVAGEIVSSQRDAFRQYVNKTKMLIPAVI